MSENLILIKDENNKKLIEFRDTIETKFESIRKSVFENLNLIRNENSNKLDDIRNTNQQVYF